MKWLLVALALAGAGCKKSEADHVAACRAALDTRPAALGKFGGVKACAPLFAAACRDALVAVTANTPTTLPGVIKACAPAYPKVDAKLPANDFFAAAVAEVKGLKEHETDAIGSMVFSELRPPAVAIHLHPDSITIDHGGTYKVSVEPSTDEVKPAIDEALAKGGKLGGIWIWGRDDATPVYRAVIDSLGDTPYVNCLRDGSNCQ